MKITKRHWRKITYRLVRVLQAPDLKNKMERREYMFIKPKTTCFRHFNNNFPFFHQHNNVCTFMYVINVTFKLTHVQRLAVLFPGTRIYSLPVPVPDQSKRLYDRFDRPRHRPMTWHFSLVIYIYKQWYLAFTLVVDSIRTRVRFSAGRPWSCIFRNWSRLGSYIMYILTTLGFSKHNFDYHIYIYIYIYIFVFVFVNSGFIRALERGDTMYSWC